MTVPTLAVQIQGQGSVTADQLNSFVQTATTCAMLRAFVGVTGMAVEVQGINAANDGGAGTFFWNASGTAPDDNFTYIMPPASAGTGEWVRLSTSAVGVTLSGVVIGPAGSNTIAPGAITTAMLADGLITTAKLANGSVTAAKLAAGAVGTAAITNNSVTNALLAQAAAMTLKGNNTGSTANEADLTVMQVQTMLGIGAAALPVAAYAHFTVGVSPSFTITMQNSSGLAGGSPVTRNSVGNYSVAVGTVAFVLGQAMVQCPGGAQGGGQAVAFSPNATMAGGNSYAFVIRSNDGTQLVDPQRVIILFY